MSQDPKLEDLDVIFATDWVDSQVLNKQASRTVGYPNNGFPKLFVKSQVFRSAVVAAVQEASQDS